MTVYGASDKMSVSSISGCDQQHFRPADLPPSEPWGLTCPAHEAWIRGDHKPKVLRHKIENGRVVAQERVADMEPGWATTPDTIPFTPDEERTHHVRAERGEQQLRALESIATLAKAGIDFRTRPDVLFYLRQNQLPEDVLRGVVVCANDHPNAPGAKFCAECGTSMTTRGTIGPGAEDARKDEAAAVDLARLHPQTLKKLCRERGLPDAGSKDDLIQRLAA